MMTLRALVVTAGLFLAGFALAGLVVWAVDRLEHQCMEIYPNG